MAENMMQTPLLPLKPRIRYHIHARPAATPWQLGRFEVDRMDHCINCGKCVDACIYGVHHRQEADVRRMAEPDHHLCRDCFRCVEQCPVGALRILPNLDYKAIGDDYVQPWMVLQMWQQAENGRVPVLGAGYRGPFGGKGWDSMWTDMSEIVRPTRDGIHGREYISTSVDLGRKPATLEFARDGRLLTESPTILQLPVPFVLSIPHGAN
ncbi:MAG: 4Fe-4S dicluster domain-containing protein, partial [bacterium]